jgi:hypothetical protein
MSQSKNPRGKIRDHHVVVDRGMGKRTTFFFFRIPFTMIRRAGSRSMRKGMG